ncbi:MAG: hypothetical protein D6710_01830 [Nitrospirae bacterium]|nr:MAG: hypothetical protein D6710_01830 [Nitrospirota bacterium]
MTVSLRQYNKIYNKYLLQFLKDGKIPTFNQVVVAAGDELPNVDTPFKPVYKYIPQLKKAVFDITNYNKAVDSIALDLTILFEELATIQITNTKRIINADLFHAVHSNELNRLNKRLDALLFALSGADDNFFAQAENFDDLSHTDTSKSTPGVVDLNESALALPTSLKGSLKISLTHLANTNNASITTSRNDVISRGNVAGTKYGNAFLDTSKPWGILYESNNGGPLSISFTFKLAREEFINRITLVHHGTKPQKAIIETSVDNVNIQEITEYGDGVILSDQSHEVVLDFEDRLVEFVHITLIKEDSDSFTEGPDGTSVHSYVFGLKNISIFTTGRERKATYVSKPFDFSGDVPHIGRAAISATESLPPGTRIDWSVALVDDNGDPIGSFASITPQSRKDESGAPNQAVFQGTLNHSEYFVTDPTVPTAVVTFQNITFYRIFTLTTEPIFGTAFLYRGYKSWLRDQSKSVNPILIKDNFISFSKGDIQELYQTSTEVKQATAVDQQSTRAVLLVDNTPIYDINKGHTLIPENGVNPEIDTKPIYAVYSAKLNTTADTITKPNVTFSSSATPAGQNPVDLGLVNIVYNGPEDIVIRRTDTSEEVIYIDGTDYIVELNDEGKPTGRILALEGSELLGYDDPNNPGTTIYPVVEIQYRVDVDVTRFVAQITGAQIFFDLDISAQPTDRIIIKYRHPAKDVIKPSIKVKDKFGQNVQTKIFTQGVDYIFDSKTAQIQRLSTGGIDPGSDVFVDFKVNDTSEQLDQFFIWAHVNQKDGVQISVERDPSVEFFDQNKLKPDPDRKEQLLASIPGVGLIDLTNAVEWPEISGWVQFVVRSIPPEELLSTSQEPLIHQVIKLKDQGGDFIFLQGGKYFSELTAIREPMQQVGFQYLKTNVRKNDDRFFAVRRVVAGGETSYEVVVNFLPNESSKLYSFSPMGPESSGGAVDGIFPVDEEWKIVWISREETDRTSAKIVVKAELTRSEDTVGKNITPKVFDYFVKIGY